MERWTPEKQKVQDELEAKLNKTIAEHTDPKTNIFKQPGFKEGFDGDLKNFKELATFVRVADL